MQLHYQNSNAFSVLITFNSNGSFQHQPSVGISHIHGELEERDINLLQKLLQICSYLTQGRIKAQANRPWPRAPRF